MCVSANSIKQPRFVVNQGRILVTSGNVCYYPVKTLLSGTKIDNFVTRIYTTMKQAFVKKLFRDTFEPKSDGVGRVGFTLKVASYFTQTTYCLDSEMKAITTDCASISDRRPEMLAELLWKTPLKSTHVKVISKSRRGGR